MHVLIFDSDAATIGLVAETAIQSEIDAVAVSGAEEFLQRLLTDPPQLIMLELQLGATDGVEQLRLLADQRYAGTVVLMSGFDEHLLETTRILAQTMGLQVEAVLKKPLCAEQLESLFVRYLPKARSVSAARLRDAIANGEMRLDFQPIVTRHPRALVKLEALIRWDHPTAGCIPPSAFVPLAETDTATIDALTEWVLRTAVEAYRTLVERGINVPLAINMSARNLHDLSWPNRVEQYLHAGAMPASHLYIEITESAAFQNIPLATEIVSRLRLKGMQLSIDDFGTGYSSLKLLQQLPFSEIKVDPSFVIDLMTSHANRAIVRSIIDLAANMEMACVVEGVETEEIAELLEQMGATSLQGYLLARPMPVEAIAEWRANWIQSGPTPRQGYRQSDAPHNAAIHADRPAGEAKPAPLARHTATGTARLAPRQLEVMRLLAEGCSVKAIARRLNIGVGTVKVHLSLAYAALGAHNRVDAIRHAGPHLLDLSSEPGVAH